MGGLVDIPLSRLSVARAGATATRFNSAGVLETVAANTARIDCGTYTLTASGGQDWAATPDANLLTAPEDFGAWSKTAATVSANVVVAPDGTQTMDKLVEDTSNGQHYVRQFPTTNGTYTFSVFAKAGERQLQLNHFNPTDGSRTTTVDLAAGTLSGTAAGTTATITPYGGGVYRIAWTFTSAATGDVKLLLFNGTTSTYTGDGASGVYLWGAKLEVGSSATGYQPQTPACRGLLVEPSRTNAVRNPRCEGAAAGAPGTLPTYWGASSLPSGVTRTIVGTGTEDGIPYIDIRWQGTGSGYFDTTLDSVAATTGQTATASAYCRLIAGSWANFSSANIILYETPSFSQSAGVSLLGVTGAALRTQRRTATRTMTIATTTAGAMRLALTAAGAVDVTLRFGLPQLELGAWASSPILPPLGAPAVSTRNADVPSMPLAEWFSQGAGTLVIDGLIGTPSPVGPLAVVHDASGDNRYQVGAGSAAAVAAGSVMVLLAAAAPVTVGAVARSAFAFAADDFGLSANGSAVSTDTAGVLPVGMTTLTIGKFQFGGAQSWEGHIQRLQYAPRRLSNAELVAVTSGGALPSSVTTPATGNCLLSWVNLARRSATTITSTSAAAGLGAERLKDPQVRRRMRTLSGASSVALNVDLGTAQEVGVLALLQPDDAGWIDEDGEAVGFLDPTADTIRHRLDAVTPGAGALYDSLYHRDATYTGATLDLNFAGQSYREYQNGTGSGVVHGYGLHAHVLPAAVQARHWQTDIAFPSLATTPGYLDLGLPWIGPAFRPSRNFAYEWGDRWDDLSDVTEVRRSGQDFVDNGPKKRVLTFAFKALTEPEAKVAMAELGRIAGTSSQVLFIQEPNGPYQGRQAIIGRLVEVAPITQPNFALYERVFQIRQSL